MYMEYPMNFQYMLWILGRNHSLKVNVDMKYDAKVLYLMEK